MAGICLSTVSQLLMWFWLKRPIKDAENILLIYAAGSYWEFIAPLYIAAAVTDLYDIAVSYTHLDVYKRQMCGYNTF